MGEPIDRKEVFDERQNQVRSKLTIEALWVCIGLSGIMVFINEEFCWASSTLSLMAVCGALAFLWWTIRCAVKDCIFGIKGLGTISTAWTLLAESAVFILLIFLGNEQPLISENGLVGVRLPLMIGYGILVISSLIVIIMNKKRKTAESKDTQI